MQYRRKFTHFYHSLRRKWRVTSYFKGNPREGRNSDFQLVFPQAPLVIGVASEPGYREKNNRDSYRVFEAYADILDNTAGEIMPVAVVASHANDSTGQSSISQLAVETIYTAIRTYGNGYQSIEQLLSAAIQQATQTISQQAAMDPQVAGVGTMVMVTALLHNKLYFAYVGECYAYLIRNGVIHRLTVTPAYASATALTTSLSPRLQRTVSPPPSPVTQAHGRAYDVGGTTAIMPSAQQLLPANSLGLPLTKQLTLNANDILILCTPGLHSVVNEQEILHAVAHHQPQEAAWQLAIQANQARAASSYTVLIMQQTRSRAYKTRSGYNWRAVRRGIVMAICLLLIIVEWFSFATHQAYLANRIDTDLPATLVMPLAQKTSLPRIEETKVPSTAMSPKILLAVPKGIDTPTTGLADQLTDTPLAVATNAVPPLAVVISRLTTRTTLNTFPQSIADTLKTVSAAMVAARTATAVAIPSLMPTMTATPRPTLPPATPVPTRTSPPRRTPSTQNPTPTVQSPLPGPIDLTKATVVLLEPAEYDTLNDKRAFRWKTNYVLPPGYAFELVFWKHGQDPLRNGKGYGGLSSEAHATIGYEHFRIRSAPEGEYLWGVLLVIKEPYQRVKYLGGNRVIYVKQR